MLFFLLFIFVLLYGSADASALGPITAALNTAEAEARSSVVPAVAGILAVIVLISVGAGVVRAVNRST